MSNFKSGDRVRYTGTTRYLKNHTGTVSWAYSWSDEVEIAWDHPYPIREFNPIRRSWIKTRSITTPTTTHTTWRAS